MQKLAAILFCFAAFAAAAEERSSALADARRELLASRYEKAVELYTPLTADDSTAAEANLGIVQAQLNLARVLSRRTRTCLRWISTKWATTWMLLLAGFSECLFCRL